MNKNILMAIVVIVSVSQINALNWDAIVGQAVNASLQTKQGQIAFASLGTSALETQRIKEEGKGLKEMGKSLDSLTRTAKKTTDITAQFVKTAKQETALAKQQAKAGQQSLKSEKIDTAVTKQQIATQQQKNKLSTLKLQK